MSRAKMAVSGQLFSMFYTLKKAWKQKNHIYIYIYVYIYIQFMHIYFLLNIFYKYHCLIYIYIYIYIYLSLRVFGLLSSSSLLFPQRFGRYVLRPSSVVCRTREPSLNFELRPLLNPRGSPVLIPLAINRYKC